MNSALYESMRDNALSTREDQRRNGDAPCECNVTTCKFYNGDFLDYNCDDSSGEQFIFGCKKYREFNGVK